MLTRVVSGIRAGSLAAALAFTTSLPALPAVATTAPDLPADLAAQVGVLMSSVANIKTTLSSPQGTMFIEGSGFVIDPSGLILTNRHVIAGAYKITVNLPELPPMTAKAEFISPQLDLAILKVEADKPLPAVKLGDSDTVKVGDRVLLIGNALGLRRALSTGVISALNADIGDTMYDHYFQTDGALNHGNSGGPMFDLKGEVVAIDTALISSPGNTGSIGIGFAMPINDAKFIVDQFRKTGQVSAGFVGVRAQRINDDLAEAFGLKSTVGAIVTQVDPKGPAAGKVLDGDVILSVNGQDASDMPAVARLVATTPNGGVLDVRLRRGDEEKSVTVPVVRVTVNEQQAMTVLGHAPEQRTVFATPSKPGMELAPITEEMRTKLGLEPGQQGMVVTEVDEGSAAALRQIRVGEVIERVGGRPVNSSDDLHAALKAIAATHSEFAPLLVLGAQGPRWVALPLDAGS